MIDFEMSPEQKAAVDSAHRIALEVMRPHSRYYDENEHETPWEYINKVWGRPGAGFTVAGLMAIEEFCWGDAGIWLNNPGSQLGGAAVQASGTPEQRVRFLSRFADGEPKWGAMAMTEPGCGSDTSAIQTTAVRNGEEWALNGEKIFVTGGKKAAEIPGGFVLVWANVDKSAGRAGMKPFVVEAGTPGMKVEKLEKKLGIRASDTAAITFTDCRIPLDNIIGSAEVRKAEEKKPAAGSGGFRGAMATFDATRPITAASALGVARAALDFIKEALEKQGIKPRYGLPRYKLTAIERDLMDMEANYKAAKMLVLRAGWLMNQFQPNSLEASMAKAKAGLAVTKITQRAVEMMGPLGYSRKSLLEKWMRDAKINDIFEGTGQINLLIVARRILGFSREQLK